MFGDNGTVDSHVLNSLQIRHLASVRYWAKPHSSASSVAAKRMRRLTRESGTRQGWMPNGQDRKAGLVHDSLTRSVSCGGRPLMNDFKIYMAQTQLIAKRKSCCLFRPIYN